MWTAQIIQCGKRQLDYMWTTQIVRGWDCVGIPLPLRPGNCEFWWGGQMKLTASLSLSDEVDKWRWEL